MYEKPLLSGRTVIYTSEEEINSGNILDVLSAALMTHGKNAIEEAYLYNYYKGIQPIINREKEYNEYINNKIVVNRANEIVSFKVGYLMGEPIQYVSRRDDENVSNEIRMLNDYMYAEGKEAKDEEIANWFSIVGTSYRLVLPPMGDEEPFRIFSADPRSTFVVYSNTVDHRPLMGVLFVDDKKGNTIYTCYTETECYTIKNGKEIISVTGHLLGNVPVVEYPANKERMGEFEVVIDLLDAMNTAESNRLDGLEQFIQSLMVIKGVDVDEDDNAVVKAKEMGAVVVPSDGDVRFLTQELNQAQTQVLIDDMYQIVLTIVGMPNRNGGRSTSDTGAAVLLRDGWEMAETKARRTEMIFKASEKRMLNIALRLMNTFENTSLKLNDLEIRFTRRNYENIQAKAQVLLQMLSSDKIHPQLAFEHCGMFSDANLAYKMSLAHYDEVMEKEEQDLQRALNEGQDDETVPE